MKGAPDKLWQRCSPNDRLLLAALRGEHEDSAEVDWERVLEIAVRHQVAPLVFQNLGTHKDLVARMPRDVAVRFHHETMRNMAAKTAMQDALGSVIRWLDDRDVPVMLVKGTSLDRRGHGEPWLTVSGDIDLMLGKRLPGISQEVRSRIWQWNSERPAIDVHCTPHPDLVMNGILPVDFDGVWERAEQIEVAGRRAWQMDLLDELLAACINSCRKRYFRLKSVWEIHDLLTHNEIDWDELARRARAWECHWIAYTALFATHAALGSGIPTDLRRRLRVPRLRAAALRWLAVRRSFCSFGNLYDRVEMRGKNVGRSLLLCYASHTARQLWRSLRVLRGQMTSEATR